MTEVGLVLLVLAIVMLVIANLIERKTMKNRVINRIVKCFKRTLPNKYKRRWKSNYYEIFDYI